VPKVVVYENYYNKVDEQTFGVDLEARARADKKRVPVLITTLLTYLDHHYPDLEGDEARRGVWLVDVPLAQVHKLRARVNDGKPISQEVLSEYDIPTIANLLKLYLLELPGNDIRCAALVVFPSLTRLRRLTCQLSRLRNHPHHLHNPGCRRHRRFAHRSLAADAVAAAAHEYRYSGCLHEPLYSTHRLDLG